MMSAKCFGVILCVLAILSLSACSMQINKTPYESATSQPSSGDDDGSTTTTLQLSNSTEDENGSNENTNSGGSNSTSNSKPTSAKGTTAADNEIDWDDIAGSNESTSASENKTTTTFTTTNPTTVPTKQDNVKGVSLPEEGYTPDGRIQVGTVNLTGNTVSIEIKNITKGYETDQESYFEYICHDEDGKELKRDKLRFGRVHKLQSRICEFTIPAGTSKVELTNLVVEYWSDDWK